MRCAACPHVKLIMVDKNGNYSSHQQCDHCPVKANGRKQQNVNYIPIETATRDRLDKLKRIREAPRGSYAPWDEQFVSDLACILTNHVYIIISPFLPLSPSLETTV